MKLRIIEENDDTISKPVTTTIRAYCVKKDQPVQTKTPQTCRQQNVQTVERITKNSMRDQIPSDFIKSEIISPARLYISHNKHKSSCNLHNSKISPKLQILLRARARNSYFNCATVQNKSTKLLRKQPLTNFENLIREISSNIQPLLVKPQTPNLFYKTANFTSSSSQINRPNSATRHANLSTSNSQKIIRKSKKPTEIFLPFTKRPLSKSIIWNHCKSISSAGNLFKNTAKTQYENSIKYHTQKNAKISSKLLVIRNDKNSQNCVEIISQKPNSKINTKYQNTPIKLQLFRKSFDTIPQKSRQTGIDLMCGMPKIFVQTTCKKQEKYNYQNERTYMIYPLMATGFSRCDAGFQVTEDDFNVQRKKLGRKDIQDDNYGSLRNLHV